jgi:hypothetical protein
MTDAWGGTWGTTSAWGVSFGTSTAPSSSGGGFAPLIPMPLKARRVRTRIIEVDDELLALLALNPSDQDLLLLMALANYEPQ